MFCSNQLQLATSHLAAVAVGTVVYIAYNLYYQWRITKRAKLKEALRAQKKVRRVKIPPWLMKKVKTEEIKVPDIPEKKLQELNRRRPAKEWNTVILFPDLLPDRPDAPLKQLKKYFQAAKVSIHLCVYLCSLREISSLIREKYREGLLVLVITDYDTWTAHNNIGLKSLDKDGIQVKLNMNGYLMHNKFSIIDEEAVLTGSLNWTKQGARTNNENVMVTTDPRLTSQYVQEFGRLWSTCKAVDEVMRSK